MRLLSHCISIIGHVITFAIDNAKYVLKNLLKGKIFFWSFSVKCISTKNYFCCGIFSLSKYFQFNVKTRLGVYNFAINVRKDVPVFKIQPFNKFLHYLKNTLVSQPHKIINTYLNCSKWSAMFLFTVYNNWLYSTHMFCSVTHIECQ